MVATVYESRTMDVVAEKDLVSSLAARPKYSDSARSVLRELDARLELIERAVIESRIGKALLDSETPGPTVKRILAELMLSVHRYQPHTTEAGFAMIGRLPKDETKLLMALTHHKAEEAEHGLWARRDFLALGGPAHELERPSTPITFAVAAVWWRMATAESPFAYLGAEYLFEKLTMRLAPIVMERLATRGLKFNGLGFLVEHATEDIKHTNLITHWILDIATRYPDAGSDILRGFDYFANVYPLPVWDEAFLRATA